MASAVEQAGSKPDAAWGAILSLVPVAAAPNFAVLMIGNWRRMLKPA